MSSADEAMSRYARGDSGAYGEVYDAVAPRLVSYLRRHVRQAAVMEDIVQQTFLQMHAARGTFIPGAAVLPWAFAISRRLMIDGNRRRVREDYVDMSERGWSYPGQRASGLSAPSENGEEALTARETEARLSSAYRALSDRQRAAYELVSQEGLTHAEAACVLGTTVTGIKLRVHRVYLALRAALDEGPVPVPLPVPLPHAASSPLAPALRSLARARGRR